MTGLRRLVVPRGPAVLSVLGDLEKALAGGDALQPVAEAESAPLPELAELPEEVPDGVAVVVGTSGSTGSAKRALLTAESLVASATSTHEVLGGPGRWLLAMPAHHVAGLQVLVRSVRGGDHAGGARPGRRVRHGAASREATERMAAGAERRYTALVPTQLTRLLDDPAGIRALRSLDGVLVGGAATSAADRERARSRVSGW